MMSISCREEINTVGSFFLLYLRGQLSSMKLKRDGVADLDLGGVAEDGTRTVHGDGVTAFENFQGTAFFELQGEASEALAVGAEQALSADAEIGGVFFEVQAKRGNFHTKIKRDDAQMRDGEALARLFEARAKAESEARGHFIGALALLAKQLERTAEARSRREFVNPAADYQDAVAHLFRESAAQLSNVLVEFAPSLHDEFGSGGRCGSAHIGDEVGDGEIGFVADARDNRNLRIEDGSGDDFFIKDPQIFERAAAANEHQHVDELFGIEELQRLDDFLGGAFALHAHGKNGEMDIGKASPEDAHDVAHGGSARRSDEADAAGEKRQGLLARGIEEAFVFEALFQLIKR